MRYLNAAYLLHIGDQSSVHRQELLPQHHGVGKSGEGKGQVQTVVLDPRVAGAHSEKCTGLLLVFSLCSHCVLISGCARGVHTF